MDARDSLRATIGKLQEALEVAKTEVTSSYVYPEEHNPYAMRDTNGRFILLDGLTALANAEASLAALDLTYMQMDALQRETSERKEVYSAFNDARKDG